MWPFNKKSYADIFQLVENCDYIFESNYQVELLGMFYQGKLHGYGFVGNHEKGTISLGIYKNGVLYKNLGKYAKSIQKSIGKDSKMITSKVFGCGVFIGELMSPAGYSGNSKLRRDRYGIMILRSGMYVGKFPPGYFLTKCEGYFFNLEGIKEKGIFNIEIEDKKRWGNDLLGEYAPSY